MSAINTLNGRNVSAARVPSLKSILGEKPVCPADAYAFNALKDALAGNYRSKDVVRVRHALDVARKVLSFVGELIEARDLGDYETAEDVCLATDGKISTAGYACGVCRFFKRLFAVECQGLIESILNGKDQKIACSSLGLILWAFDAYEEIGDFKSTAILYGGSVRGWIDQICKGIDAEEVATAQQILESLSRFFADAGEVESIAQEG